MTILDPAVLILIPIILFFTNKKNLFFSLSAIFVVLILSGIAKEEIKKVKIKDSSIVLLFDTTYSMATKDLKPNRLEYAKKQAVKFIKQIDIPIAIFNFNSEVHLLSLPTTDKKKLISQILKLKPIKAHTDIAMAINKIKSLTNSKTTIILISDGGEKKIKGNFILWGFATKKGGQIPGFNVVSKLNIIGNKFFAYNQVDKLLQYVKHNKQYIQKTIKIYKPTAFIFAIFAFISFVIGIAIDRLKLLIIIVFLFPIQIKANDTLACFYEYIGLKNLAFKEFKKGKSDLAKIKTAIFYLQKKDYKNALKKLNDVKNYPKKNYLKALILTKLKRYNEAYEILKNTPLDKNGIKLYNILSSYIKNKEKSKYKTKIYQIHIDKQNKSRNFSLPSKDHLW